MGTKRCCVVLGLTTLTVLFISLSSATAAYFEVRTQEDRQNSYIPPPPAAPPNQNNTITSNSNAYSNPYSSVYINPVANTQPNANYQLPLINPSTSLYNNTGDLSTWNSTYAVGNYGISSELNQPEFAVSSPDDFAPATPVDIGSETVIAGKNQTEKPTGLSSANYPEINKPY